MAQSEIRDAEYNCPKCGDKLKTRWVFKTLTLAGDPEWSPEGRSFCPKGHKVEFNLAGQPIG